MQALDQLSGMNAEELRAFAARLITEIADTRRDNQHKQLRIDQLTHEMAVLRRWKVAPRSEQLHGEQRQLFEEMIEADLQAIGLELEALSTASSTERPQQQPRRAPLPANLPRVEIRHEPDSTGCGFGCAMKRIGEDVTEKLDYTPGVFTVQRHVRGKWACAGCGTLVQAPVPAQVIDKGIPTAGLLAQVLVSKYTDHAPLYRQEAMFARAGLPIARSTLAQWVGVCGVRLQPLVQALREAMLACAVLHADETPVAMLVPGKGKTHRAYIWAYGTSPYDGLKAVVYDFADGRSGEHARDFLGPWRGKLVCDDFSGYKALFAQGVTEAECLAHARRKFHELWASNKSPVAEEALRYFGAIYEVEELAGHLDAEKRCALRRARSRPIVDNLHQWLVLQRQKATHGTALAKAIDYSLKRWEVLTRFVDDGALAVDNNHLENRIHPIALGRSNWLFAGSLRAGKRAAAVMSLIQSARLNGHDPYAYLKDVLKRLPTQPNSRIDELLPHRWAPIAA
jgi:transposase